MGPCGSVQMTVGISPAQLFFLGATILTAKNGNREQLREILDLLDRGLIRSVIHERFALGDAAKAHELVESGRSFGRVIIDPRA